MVVPPEAKQKQDLAFLKGDWRSRTGLATASGEKDLRPSYTLDDKGKLVIEEKSNPKCTDGRTYARNIVNCDVGADGVAQCTGRQPGDTRSYNVQIGR
jgi:hypothetical protein